MALSSPGQLRAIDLTGESLIPGSLSDSLNDALFQDFNPDVPFEHPEPDQSTQVPAEDGGQAGQSDVQKDAISSNMFDDSSMLLKRPCILQKPPAEDKGYQYGPAVQLAPDQFTKRPIKPAPFHQDDMPQPPQKRSSPLRSQEDHGVQSSFPGLGGARAGRIAPNTILPPDPLDRSGEQRQAIPQGFPNDTKPRPSVAVGGNSLRTPIGKPPFPNSPPVGAVGASQRNPAIEETIGSPTLPSGGQPWSQPFIIEPATAPTPAPHIKQPSSEDNAHDHDPSQDRQVSKHDQRARSSIHKHDERDVKHTHHGGSSTRDHHQPVEDSTVHGRNQLVNRPLRDTPHGKSTRPVSRVRPGSRSSNVSKQKSINGSLASSPLLRQRRTNISHEFTAGLAGIINQFTQQQNNALEEQRTRYRKYIKELERELAGGSSVIAQQLALIDAQTKQIKELQESREQMEAHEKDIEIKLAASEDRARRLEEKYHLCKTHVNSAIQEQQDLYTRSKKQWGDAIDQVRAMEKAQNMKGEMAVRKAEVIREQMMEKVQQIVAQYKTEALELYGKINTLTQQLEARDAELDQEKASVRALSEKLQDLQTTSAGFEGLAVQNKEIMDKLEEQHKAADDRHQRTGQELRDRLDAIADRLEALSNMTSGQPGVLSKIQETQAESWTSVTAKLDTVLKSQGTAKEATSNLSANLELQMKNVWERLDGQVESLGKQLAEKAEENGMVSALYRRKEAECQQHEMELAALKETAGKQAEQIRDLEANLIAMDAAQDENEETIRRLEASAAESGRLREELKSRDTTVAELQKQLSAKDQEYTAEVNKHSSRIYQLSQLVEEKDQSSRIAVHQATEAARREIRIEMERGNAERERLLHGTQQERDSLLRQLKELEQRIQGKEQTECQTAATISSLKKELLDAQAKRQTASKELEQHSANLAQLESRLTSQIKALEAGLESSKKRTAELEGQCQRQSARSQALVAGLRQWATQEGLDIGNLDSLNNDNATVGDVSAGIVRALEQLRLPQRSQTNTEKERADDLLLDGEESRFFPDQNGHQAHSALGESAGSSQLRKGQTEEPGFANSQENKTDGCFAEGFPGLHPSKLHQLRRVVVRSPANVPSEPAPPSIDQEKVRRRGALQPKSIMKRVTRSTAGVAQHDEADARAGQGAFKRIGQGVVSSDSSAFKGQDTRDARASNGTSGEGATDSRLSGKRKRLETSRSESSSRQAKSSKQARKASSSIMTQLEESVNSKPRAPAIGQQQPAGARHPDPALNIGSSQTKSDLAQNSRENSGLDARNLSRTPSANTRQVLGPRPANLRTYGSQRNNEPSGIGGQPNPQFLLRSHSKSEFRPETQSQSRFWPKSKDESQESMVSSQNGSKGDEDLLLPFSDLAT